MLRKLIVLAIACGVSLSASASYVQYDLNNIAFDDGSHLTGWFVQNTATNGIAFYDLVSTYNPYIPGDNNSGASNARITVAGGPTGFDAWSRINGVDSSNLHLEFGPGATAGTYSVTGFETMTPAPLENLAPASHTITGGSVQVGSVQDAQLLALIESGQAGFTEVAPVPEPGSLALLAAGLGLMGRLRARRKEA